MTNATGATLTWLGQAGFAIRATGGELCLIDPYLSDYGGREGDVSRVPPIVLDPSTLEPAVVVTSHSHEDHHDPDTIRAIAANSPETIFAGPPANVARCIRWKIPEARTREIDRGETVEVGPFAIRGNFARHDVPGWICEDAISMVVTVDGVSIFHSGDGEYDSRVWQGLAGVELDVGLVAINGTGGNMDVEEAALMTSKLAPGLAIPMHYGMWADAHYGPGATIDPEVFVATYARLSDGRSRILTIGETIDLVAA